MRYGWLAAAVLLAGCSTAATGAVTTPAVVPARHLINPADPRLIFVKTGAGYSTPYGGSAVQRDVYEDKFVCGLVGGTQERICVYTFASADRQQQDLTQPGSGDGEVTVKGSLWDVWVIPATDANGNFTFPVSPQQIAQQVHGTVARA